MSQLSPTPIQNGGRDYTITNQFDERAGCVVKRPGERGYRFFSSTSVYDALDGRLFVSPDAAQNAVNEITPARPYFRNRSSLVGRAA